MIGRYVGSTRLILRRGLSSATGSYYVGLTDPGEMGFLLHLLRPNDLFMDVGANIGIYTVLAAGVCGATVCAVEPANAALPHLADNLRLNEIEALVTTHPVALGEINGTARLSAGLGTTNRIICHDVPQEAATVAMSTLDALLGGAVPLLLKLDVEGHEAQILRGGPRTLSASTLRAAIIETNGRGAVDSGGDSVVHAAMTEAGFSAAVYDPTRRSLTLLQSPTFPNTLYVRDCKWLKMRLAEAASYEVLGCRY
ncbi:FkbM family methyltransferase [Humitalea sp. 24SJ18S-53]|uniref:FkbM family methyltransferase n=1 Tax=Humitalea sp. 24SJ18S-53 TaxID=3422307 RepID=UPI003D6667A2